MFIYNTAGTKEVFIYGSSLKAVVLHNDNQYTSTPIVTLVIFMETYNKIQLNKDLTKY